MKLKQFLTLIFLILIPLINLISQSESQIFYQSGNFFNEIESITNKKLISKKKKETLIKENAKKIIKTLDKILENESYSEYYINAITRKVVALRYLSEYDASEKLLEEALDIPLNKFTRPVEYRPYSKDKELKLNILEGLAEVYKEKQGIEEPILQKAINQSKKKEVFSMNCWGVNYEGIQKRIANINIFLQEEKVDLALELLQIYGVPLTYKLANNIYTQKYLEIVRTIYTPSEIQEELRSSLTTIKVTDGPMYKGQIKMFGHQLEVRLISFNPFSKDKEIFKDEILIKKLREELIRSDFYKTVMN